MSDTRAVVGIYGCGCVRLDDGTWEECGSSSCPRLSTNVAAERDAALAENQRLREVVEAAERLADPRPRGPQAFDQLNNAIGEVCDAVHALRALSPASPVSGVYSSPGEKP